MKCINRQAAGQLSSFFPGKRDEVATSEDQEYLRMQRNGVTVEPLNFPATQSVLWNRTAQGESETLHLTTKRNARLYINEKTLRLAHRHVNQNKSSFECFLVGSISVDSREDSIDVTVDRFDPGREVPVNNGSAKVKRKVPTTVVPGDHIVPISLIQGLSGADISVTHTKEEFHKAFQVLFGRISNQGPVSLSHLVSLRVCCHSHRDDDEIIINVNCGTIAMGTRIHATSVASVPIIPTALARNLSGPLRLSEVQGMPKSGYLTMDHTRKLLLLLESDPKAFSLPLLGIWVSGIYSIHHPFIWACCLRFIHSKAIQQRVLAPPNSFLLLLYSPVNSTPQFWECCQDLGQSEMKVFEFYSCYENLHLEIPPGPSSSDPLCFELFPAPEGLSRSVFEQAVEIWEKEHNQARVNQDGINPCQNQVMTAMRQGSGEEEPSPEPRPFPSPYPQNLQFVLPDVADVSLSFEEQVPRTSSNSEKGCANQQIFPRAKPQQKIVQKESQKRVQHDQENGQMRLQEERSPGFLKGKQNVKQFRNNGARQNSPSREPLKQILVPNQTHPRVMNHKQFSQKPHPMQGSVVQKTPIRRRNSPGHNMQEKSPKSLIDHSIPRSKVNGKQPSPKGPHAVRGTELKKHQQQQKISTQRMRTKPQDCEGVDSRALPNLQNRQLSSNPQDDENRGRQINHQQFVRPSDDQELNPPVQRPFLETVFEGETPDGTLNKSMSETELELQLTDTSQSSQSSLISVDFQRGVTNADSGTHATGMDGLLDQDGKQTAVFHGVDKWNQHGFVQTQKNTEDREGKFTQPVVCGKDGDEERLDRIVNHMSEERMDNTAGPVSNSSAQQQACDREIQQSKATEKHTEERRHEGTFPENKQAADNVTGNLAEVTRPDPYELLMRQGAQLKQLQEQIKLLLQQQNAPLPTPNPLLTPPRTPHFESSHGNNRALDHAPVFMVTACTNTGASLLLGTPVKPSGKRSAATSPMKEKEMNHRKRSLPASSTETSQHNAKESQKHEITVNPEELANQVIEVDDPSQTLASSLHAVDIPSFVESPSGVTSPSPADQAKRGGMETSFTSPVLGESASILVENRWKEGESHTKDEDGVRQEERTGVKSNHVSLLQRNERQFYDNLLNQVKTILDQQPQEEPSQEADQKEHVTVHEPTHEEVVMATMKELQKIQGSTLGTGNTEPTKSPFSAKHLSLHRSASLSAIPDHPHINYVSFSVDETLDEVFNEAYLKYLTDNQLQELQQMSNSSKKQGRDRAVTFSVLEEGRSALLRKESVDKEHLCNQSSLSSTDYTWNNLSMATKQYLGKYCLAPTQPGNADGTGECNAAKKVTDISGRAGSPRTPVASQGYTAPPSTPEPANKDGNDSQILDIMRLKKLPKLF